MEIRVLYFEGCPHAELARERVSAVLRPPATCRMQLIESLDDAVREGMHGSPTILVDGIDLFASPGTVASWSCRIYQTPDGPDGAPALTQIASALEMSTSTTDDGTHDLRSRSPRRSASSRSEDAFDRTAPASIASAIRRRSVDPAARSG